MPQAPGSQGYSIASSLAVSGPARSSNGTTGNAFESMGRLDLEHEGSHEATLRRDEFVRKLPSYLQESVSSLEALDDEVAALEAQFRRERLQLERRFEALYAPLLARRAALVAGEAGETGAAPPLPGFWLGVMKKETAVGANVMPEDEPALKFLRDVVCTTLPEAKGTGFSLQFCFGSNKYFSNTTLTKTYHVAGTDTEPILERAEGTEIRWKPGMNLTTKQRSNGSYIPRMSFFCFFNTLRLPSEVLLDGGREMIESDYEIGRAFKDKLVPHAVRWFTGEAEDAEEFASSDEIVDAEGMPRGAIDALLPSLAMDEAAAEEREAARLELQLAGVSRSTVR
jgi:nucleosome assembly protein 1-like 1